MALFAAGFNAWHQLDFGASSTDAEPEDLWLFSKVLQDEHLEQRPRAELSFTIAAGRSKYHVAGIGVQAGSDDVLQQTYTSCRAANGLVVVARAGLELGAEEAQETDAPAPRHYLEMHKSRQDLVSGNEPIRRLCTRPVRQVAAYDAGFLVLYQDGTVATLGDARYQACLARQITPDSPADEPGLVTDLANLGDPVKHVTAGGYSLAALTESGSIYVWGSNSVGPRRNADSCAFSDLDSMPNYHQVDGDKDVQDVALGESHAIALTMDGNVYVVGANGNGQLGLGRSRRHADAWTRVELDLPNNHEVVGVAAGPRCSIILTAPIANGVRWH